MIKKNLVVKNGSYQKNGETKHRYLTIGQLHAGQDGNDYITLDAHINLAAIPRKDGDMRVMVSLYEPRDRHESTPRSAPMRPGAPQMAADFEDDIPFN